MSEIIDYTEVPYLQEIQSFLPINPIDEKDVVSYIQNIMSLIAINYEYGQYQFAYFGVHLLFMTYLYCTAWKISRIEPERYKDAIIFARSYIGREDNLKIENADTIFSFSVMPEKDIAKIFKIAGLDGSQISDIEGHVELRNEMAHANGNFSILTDKEFDTKAHNIFISMKNIHKCMDKLIRKWFEQVLLKFCKGEYEGYEKPKDLIAEQMIQIFKLSTNELLICNEMSVSNLITEHRGYEAKLKVFKKELKEYCQEMGYI